MRTTIAATVLALIASTSVALAEDDNCTKAAKEQWLTQDQLKSKLGEQGYTVKELEFESACVEAKVADKDGKTLELKLDPSTGSVVSKDDD